MLRRLVICVALTCRSASCFGCLEIGIGKELIDDWLPAILMQTIETLIVLLDLSIRTASETIPFCPNLVHQYHTKLKRAAIP